MPENEWLVNNLDKFFEIQEFWLSRTFQVNGINHAMLKSRLNIRLKESESSYLLRAEWHNKNELAIWLVQRAPSKNFLNPKG